MTKPLLAEEILHRTEKDQDLRLNRETYNNKEEFNLLLVEVDTENTAYMKQVVSEYGWPTISLVGKQAAHAAWLLVQHADLDQAFQQQCLTLMERVSEGEIKPVNIAYLTDRLLVAKNKPQEYGTQFHKEHPGDTNWEPHPIRDRDNVDARRQQKGMQTFQENYDEINQNHNYGTKASSL